MFGDAGNFTGRVFFGAVSLAGCLSVSAPAAGAPPPNFASNPSAGWFAYTREFIAPARGAGPVRQDPAQERLIGAAAGLAAEYGLQVVLDLDRRNVGQRIVGHVLLGRGR